MSFSDPQFWLALLQIIGLDIVLSGDNAVVIALACRSLPEKQRRWGIILGGGGAVLLRVIFAIFVVYLLMVPYLKLVGGLLLLWVGYKLMVQSHESENVDAGSTLFSAVRIILIADAVMSLDNVIAVAAAARGSVLLLALGLVISIPLVIYGARLMLVLIDRFPVIVPGGAALIGYVAGEVVLTDPALEGWVRTHIGWALSVVPILAAIAVVQVGRIVAPGPAPAVGTVTGEAVGAAALAGLRLVLQILGRVIVTRAPMIVAFVISLFGISADAELLGAGESVDSVDAVLHAIRPIFAAVVAVVLGEATAWAIRRRRHRAAAPNASPGMDSA